MPTDREIAEAARDMPEAASCWVAFNDHFTPERVLALLYVVEAADSLLSRVQDSEEATDDIGVATAAVGLEITRDRLDALDGSSE